MVEKDEEVEEKGLESWNRNVLQILMVKYTNTEKIVKRNSMSLI